MNTIPNSLCFIYPQSRQAFFLSLRYTLTLYVVYRYSKNEREEHGVHLIQQRYNVLLWVLQPIREALLG